MINRWPAAFALQFEEAHIGDSILHLLCHKTRVPRVVLDKKNLRGIVAVHRPSALFYRQPDHCKPEVLDSLHNLHELMEVDRFFHISVYVQVICLKYIFFVIRCG